MTFRLSTELSRHDCYAGKERVNVYGFDPDIHGRAGIYLEFQEGCGYNPRTLTIEEARIVGRALLEAADEQEKLKY